VGEEQGEAKRLHYTSAPMFLSGSREFARREAQRDNGVCKAPTIKVSRFNRGQGSQPREDAQTEREDAPKMAIDRGGDGRLGHHARTTGMFDVFLLCHKFALPPQNITASEMTSYRAGTNVSQTAKQLAMLLSQEEQHEKQLSGASLSESCS